jgi:hypothetical protein
MDSKINFFLIYRWGCGILLKMKTKHTSFIALSRKNALDYNALDYWEKVQKNENFYPAETVYVSNHDLREIAVKIRKDKGTYTSGMVWAGMPGFMCQSWVNKHSTRSDYRFDTGHYHSLWALLLVDDIFEWVHRRIESKDVRSAADIVWKMAGKKSKTPIYF